MTFTLKGINKLMNDIKAKQEKTQTRKRYKEMGYSPRCSICNHPDVDEIEQLYEAGHTYEFIKEHLNLDMSLMSLSRHFRNHYPKSVEFKQKKKLEMLERVQQSYKKYPFLEDYFKNKSLEDLTAFNSDAGLCTDCFKLCEHIRPCTATNGYNNIKDLKEREKQEIKNYYKNSYGLPNKDTIQNIRNQYNNIMVTCMNCRNKILNDRIELLEKIITNNFIKLPSDANELYYMMLNYEGDTNEFIESMTE